MTSFCLPAPRIDRRKLAPAQQQQPRRQAAAAADPASHRRGIGFQHRLSRLPARHRCVRGGRSSARRGSRARRAASRRCARSAPSSAPACRPTGTGRRSPRARRTRAPGRTDRGTGRPGRPGWRGCGHRRAPARSPRRAPSLQEPSLMRAIRVIVTFERMTWSKPWRATRFLAVAIGTPGQGWASPVPSLARAASAIRCRRRRNRRRPPEPAR